MTDPASSAHLPMGARRFGRVNWLGLLTLAERENRRFLAVWTQTLLAPLITAGLFMVIFSIAIGPRRGDVMGVDFTTFIAPGILMMTVIQNAFANTSSSIVISKVQGNIVDTLMPPLSAAEMVLGYLAGGIGRVCSGRTVRLAARLVSGARRERPARGRNRLAAVPARPPPRRLRRIPGTKLFRSGESCNPPARHQRERPSPRQHPSR